MAQPLSHLSNAHVTYSIHNGFGGVRITLEGALRHGGVHASEQSEHSKRIKEQQSPHPFKKTRLIIIHQMALREGGAQGLIM